jgi:hypothetical protein
MTEFMPDALRYQEVKCPRCGWVHAAVPLGAVLDNADSDLLIRYFRCFRCGTSSSTFVPAAPGDAPAGCTLQPVVIAE